MNPLFIPPFHAGKGKPLFFIMGPCVIESHSHTMYMAEMLTKIANELQIPFIFKASYDKANRTSIHSFRGPGLEEGLKILKEVRETFHMPVLTDVHDFSQVSAAADVVDILQIPAFLSRQTDLIAAAAKSGKIVNIKKGQFMAPGDMKEAVKKCVDSGNENVMLTERGVSFGYNNLIADMRAIPMMQELNVPVIFDATHSAQLPGGRGTETGGMRSYIPHIAKAAVAAGADGIFLEIHHDPDKALSDSATQWPLDKTFKLVADLKILAAVIRE
ncbi:MAG TPA: 3-deoxy-8-phosphooctulonate synthase [Candidatus Marinimicrobia bacterium]|nr:3-deoxy-8-phosphooctulonate synthase [Candidatus Neomarinimicrobiota bacterium]